MGITVCDPRTVHRSGITAGMPDLVAVCIDSVCKDRITARVTGDIRSFNTAGNCRQNSECICQIQHILVDQSKSVSDCSCIADIQLADISSGILCCLYCII